jgi:hypothetical protein
MTRSGLKGTSPAPKSPPWMLLGVNEALKAAIKHGKNSAFVMWLIRLRMRFSAWPRKPRHLIIMILVYCSPPMKIRHACDEK